jgi:uncharacterized protein involved in exopolysaccharide biosynthesis
MPCHPPGLNFPPVSLLGALVRYRFRASVVFLGAICLAVAIIAFQGRLYESKAANLVSPAIGANAAPVVPACCDHDGMVNTQVGLLNSRDVIVTVIRNIGLDHLCPDLSQSPDLVTSKPPWLGN